MRQGVKWAVGLLCAFGVLVCGAYRWPVGSVKVAAEISRAIPPRSGLHWRGPAHTTLALLPWPTLRVVGIELLDAKDRIVLSAPDARLPISIVGMLRGHFVPVGATLHNPTALIDLDARPLLTAQERASTGAEDGEALALWSHVRLRGGVLHVVSAARHFDTLVEGVGGSFDWLGANQGVNFALAGAWRDEAVKIEGKIGNPREGPKHGAAGVALSIQSQPVSLSLDGTWGGESDPEFSGAVSAQLRSLRALERLTGAGPAPPILGDALSFEGSVEANGASLAVSDAKFEIAGQQFEGALTLSREGGRTAISGTLAADSLKIDPLIGAPTFLNAQGGWSSAPFPFERARGLDLDLRISAAHAEWRGHRVDDAAGSLICKGGQLTATLLEASAYQGVLRGQLTLANGANGLEAQLAGSLADSDFGAALADFGWSGYRGRGGFDVSLRSTGASPAEAVASLSGTASLDLQPGVIDGVSIEEAMRRSMRRPIDVARDMAIGQTAFTSAHAKFAIANGKATISAGRVEGPGAVLAVEGSIDIAAREFHTRLLATQADAQGTPSTDAAQLTIVLSGPWSAPAVAAAPGGG